jgi:hypothetical protein
MTSGLVRCPPPAVGRRPRTRGQDDDLQGLAGRARQGHDRQAQARRSRSLRSVARSSASRIASSTSRIPESVARARCGGGVRGRPFGDAPTPPTISTSRSRPGPSARRLAPRPRPCGSRCETRLRALLGRYVDRSHVVDLALERRAEVSKCFTTSCTMQLGASTWIPAASSRCATRHRRASSISTGRCTYSRARTSTTPNAGRCIRTTSPTRRVDRQLHGVRLTGADRSDYGNPELPRCEHTRCGAAAIVLF